jgi:uncharacterized protein (DUF885 family)
MLDQNPDLETAVTGARRIVLLSSVLVVAGMVHLSGSGEFSLEEWRAKVSTEEDIDRLSKLYVDYRLEANPTFGLQIGIHGKDGRPRYYDARLPDVSTAAWAEWYETHLFVRKRLAEIEPGRLPGADRLDHHILANQVEQQILQVTELGAITDPLTYVSTLGTAFTGLILRDYAPLEQRLESFGDRCSATPRFLNQARLALLPPYVRPTAPQKQLALARLRGMVRKGGLFDKSLQELLDKAGLAAARSQAITSACGGASAAVTEFADWMERTLGPRPDREWRLGRALYERKYRLEMDYPLGPQELLNKADAELERVHGEIVAVSRRIHDRYLAEAIAAGRVKPASELRDEQVVAGIFARLAEDRSTTETLIKDSYALADTIVGFVRQKKLLDLPPTSKLRIEDIPPHLRGFAVAQILTAPPFEPQLESVWFWDLALLGTSDSYLKEYNRPTLALVYVHEGVPGHFVQQEYSNRFKRIAPKVFWNGPMVEGWAAYIATQLVDEGFTIYPDHPLGRELQQLVDDKLVLRSIINAIIDIRLHTTEWPEQEAVDLMIRKGFQEEGEAQGKLSRAKLSSVQLCTYFAGHQAILDLVEESRRRQGSAFDLKTFNERLVGAGSPPFFALRDYMLNAR